MIDTHLPALTLEDVRSIGQQVGDLRQQCLEYQRLGSPRNMERVRAQLAILLELLHLDWKQERGKFGSVTRRLKRYPNSLPLLLRSNKLKEKLEALQRAIRSAHPLPK